MGAAGRASVLIGGIAFVTLCVIGGQSQNSSNALSKDSTDATEPASSISVQDAHAAVYGPGTYTYPSSDPDEVPVFRQPRFGPMIEIWDNDPLVIKTSIRALEALYRNCPATRTAWPMIEKARLTPTTAFAVGPEGKKYGWTDFLGVELYLSDGEEGRHFLPPGFALSSHLVHPLFNIGDGSRPGIVSLNWSARLFCGQLLSADRPLIPVAGLKISPWPSDDPVNRRPPTPWWHPPTPTAIAPPPAP